MKWFDKLTMTKIPMFLIVGLGNPGKEYGKTRHNAGWLFLDYLKSLPESEFEMWKEKKKLNSLISEGTTSVQRSAFSVQRNTMKIVLAKPTTFMNLSGVAIKKLLGNYPIPYTLYPERLFVVHDDIDIPFGEFKIQTNRGPAGHHGVESIIEHLGTKDFTRVRIGIAPEHRSKAMDHVLKKFSKDELTELSTLFSRIVQSLTKQNII